jgi:hypothetical protein
MSNNAGKTIYINKESDLGQIMVAMDEREENGIIAYYRKKLSDNLMSKEEIINKLNLFMSMWGDPPSRSFTTLRKFIKELDETKEQNT